MSARGAVGPGLGALAVALVLGLVLALVLAVSLLGGVAGLLVAVALAGLLTFALRTRAGPEPPTPVASAPPLLTPVTDLSTDALGREWLRTAGALGAELEPGTRQHVVRRRQDTLDELERRDPAGFARWLADGARVDSDPASWVRGDAPQP
ncbi:MAG: conserved rane protein of unknown function [Klenkia sp.]|nr:conserved rane protein of unknown function [Klenkia sp.]